MSAELDQGFPRKDSCGAFHTVIAAFQLRVQSGQGNNDVNVALGPNADMPQFVFLFFFILFAMQGPSSRSDAAF